MSAMFIYYVYAYLRNKDSKIAKAGTPYYIGKGKGNRAFDKNHSILPPSDKSRIIFLEINLSEIGALALERRMIKWYGRIDTSTGILRNRTDGGEGSENISEESRKRRSLALTGRKISEETRKKLSIKARSKSDETIKKTSDSVKEIWASRSPEQKQEIVEKIKLKTGGTHSAATKQLLSDQHKTRTYSERTEETKKKMSIARKLYYENKRNNLL